MKQDEAAQIDRDTFYQADQTRKTIKSNTHEPITYAYMVYMIGMLSKRLHILKRLSWRKKANSKLI